MSALRTFLQEAFKAEGLSDWKGLAERAMKDVDKCKKRQRALKMRKSMNDTEIGEAMGVHPRSVKRWAQAEREMEDNQDL